MIPLIAVYLKASCFSADGAILFCFVLFSLLCTLLSSASYFIFNRMQKDNDDLDLTESDDERGRRINAFLKDPEVNVKWTDYNLSENRRARASSKGKVIEPNSHSRASTKSPSPNSRASTKSPSTHSRASTKSPTTRTNRSRSCSSSDSSPGITMRPLSPGAFQGSPQETNQNPKASGPVRDRLQMRMIKEASRSPSRSPARSKSSNKRARVLSSDSESESDSRPRLKTSQQPPKESSSRTACSEPTEPKKMKSEAEAGGNKAGTKAGSSKGSAKSLDNNWLGQKSHSFTIPKQNQLIVRSQTNRTAIVKETSRILFDRSLKLPTFDPTKLKSNLKNIKFCSFYQLNRCPVTNVLSHENKGGIYAHACATCYRISSILIPHTFHQCPFTKVVD